MSKRVGVPVLKKRRDENSSSSPLRESGKVKIPDFSGNQSRQVGLQRPYTSRILEISPLRRSAIENSPSTHFHKASIEVPIKNAPQMYQATHGNNSYKKGMKQTSSIKKNPQRQLIIDHEVSVNEPPRVQPPKPYEDLPKSPSLG